MSHCGAGPLPLNRMFENRESEALHLGFRVWETLNRKRTRRGQIVEVSFTDCTEPGTAWRCSIKPCVEEYEGIKNMSPGRGWSEIANSFEPL